MKFVKNAGLVALSALALVASNAYAVQAGDILVRVGAVNVSPNADDSDFYNKTGGAAGGIHLDVKSDTQLGLNFTYMLTDNVGVEVLAATPFTHDVTSSTFGGATVAKVKHLPPTITVQYHFDPTGAIRPYVGAGVNYTMMLETKGTGPLNGVAVDASDSFGLAGEAGVDIDLGSGFFLNAAAWYADINTNVNVNNGAMKGELQVDPWVFMAGVGTSF